MNKKPLTELMSLRGQLESGFLLIGDMVSSSGFRVIKETEKAIQIKNEDIEEKFAYPIWIPKSAIKEKLFTCPGVPDSISLIWQAWFIREMWNQPKAWKRVALGLSTY